MAEPALPLPPVETVPMVTPDGATVRVPASQASTYYRTGEADFIRGTSVPIVVEGQSRIVDAMEAASAIDRDFTAETTSRAHVAEQAEEQAYAGAAKGAKAFAVGAGNALTLGFGKGIAAKLGGQETAEEIAALERQRPYLMGAGEAAGFLAPLALSGGTAAIGRGAAAGAERGLLARGASAFGQVATAPVRGLGLAGEAAGNLAERAAVGLGASEGGGVARVLGGAARGAAEMPIYEIGNAVSRAAVHDEPLTAEQLFAAGGHGLLLGAAFGGGLGAAGQLLRGGGKLAVRAAEKAGELGEHLGAGMPSLEAFAQRKAIQSTGANLPQIEKLGAEGGAFWKRTAAMIEGELPAVAGKKSLATMSHAELAEAAPLLRKKVGKDFDGLIDQLDRQGAVGPDLARVATAIEPMEAELAKSLAPKAYEATVRELRGRIAEIAESGPVSFRKALELKGDLQAIVRKSKLAEGTVNEYRAAIADIIDAEIAKAGTKASGDAGAEWAARYAKAKQDYAAAKWIEKATEKGAKSEARNRSVGLSEQFGAIGGALALGASGPGALLAGAAGAVAQNLVRRYGDQVAAAVAGKAVRSDLVKAIGDTVSETLGRHAAGFVDRSSLKVKLAQTPGRGAWAAEAREIERRGKERSARESVAKFREQREQLARVTPASLQERTAGLESNPSLRAAVVLQAQQAATFLLGKLPPQPPSMHPLQNGGVSKERMPAPGDVQKFGRYARAVDDPLSVIDDMKRGRISREGVEALKAVYPRMYGQAQGAVMAAIATRTKPLSYEQEKQLAVLLDIPISPLFEPGTMAAIQATYAPVPAPPPMGQGGASLKPFDVAKETLTLSQRLAAKGLPHVHERLPSRRQHQAGHPRQHPLLRSDGWTGADRSDGPGQQAHRRAGRRERHDQGLLVRGVYLAPGVWRGRVLLLRPGQRGDSDRWSVAGLRWATWRCHPRGADRRSTTAIQPRAAEHGRQSSSESPAAPVAHCHQGGRRWRGLPDSVALVHEGYVMSVNGASVDAVGSSVVVLGAPIWRFIVAILILTALLLAAQQPWTDPGIDADADEFDASGRRVRIPRRRRHPLPQQQPGPIGPGPIGPGPGGPAPIGPAPIGPGPIGGFLCAANSGTESGAVGAVAVAASSSPRATICP